MYKVSYPVDPLYRALNQRIYIRLQVLGQSDGSGQNKTHMVNNIFGEEKRQPEIHVHKLTSAFAG